MVGTNACRFLRTHGRSHILTYKVTHRRYFPWHACVAGGGGGEDFRLTQLVNRKHPTVLRLRPLMASFLHQLQHQHRRLPGPLPLHRRNHRLQVHDLQLQLEKNAYFSHCCPLPFPPSVNRTIVTSIGCFSFLLSIYLPFPFTPFLFFGTFFLPLFLIMLQAY